MVLPIKATERQDPKPQPHTHLRTGLVALLLFVALVAASRPLLGRWESRYLYTLAPMAEDETVRGISLSRQAARQKDLLMLLGSSELTFQDEYHPAKIFDGQPSGFSVYLIGSGYRQSIHNVLALSALGADVKDKQVVLFITPSWFTNTLGETAHRKNFSPVQAYEFAYTSPVSPDVKRRGARRLLALGSPATDDPLLRVALSSIAADNLWGRACYYATWPLGRLRLESLRLHDEVQTVRLIISRRLQPRSRPTVHGPAPDWDRLIATADREARSRSASNEFGMNNTYYAKYVAPRLDQLRNSAAGESWLHSSEYSDLDLVLATLKDLHVRPLFISLPVMGRYYDFKGHPAADRQAYYARVRKQVEGAGFPVVDLGSQEYEMGFMRDPWHPGWKGSVQIAQAMERFYHSPVPEPAR